MGSPISGFMLGLLGAGKALETGTEFYERRKEREQKGQQAKIESGQEEEKLGLQKQELNLDEQKLNQSKSLVDAEIKVKEAQARAANALADERKRETSKGNTKYDSMQLGAIRSRLDALTSYQKSGGQLTPEDQAEYQGLSEAFNKKTGVSAKPVQAVAPALPSQQESSSIHDWLFGKKAQQQDNSDPLGLMK